MTENTQNVNALKVVDRIDLTKFKNARTRLTVNAALRGARSPVFSGSSRISAPISRLPDRSQNLPYFTYLTRHSLASEINVLETFCSSAFNNFLSRVCILTRVIDIAIMSVRDVPVSDENGLTYRHRFFTIR